MRAPAFLDRIRDWLMAGYPDGIPTKDYSPVLALLGREQLTDEEVAALAEELAANGTLHETRDPDETREELVARIRSRLDEEPSEAEIERVQAMLGVLTRDLDPAAAPTGSDSESVPAAATAPVDPEQSDQ